MEERKTMIEFTEEEMDKILEYMEFIEAETVQEAIMHAISVLM